MAFDRLQARLNELAIDGTDWEAWYRSMPAEGQRQRLWMTAGIWTIFAACPVDHSLAPGSGVDAHRPLNQTQALAAIAHAGDIAGRLLDAWERLTEMRFEPFDRLADNVHYATLRAGWCSISFWWADLNEVRACLDGDFAAADDWHKQASRHRAELSGWLQRIGTILKRPEEDGETLLLFMDDRAFELLTGTPRPRRLEEGDGWPWQGPRI